MCWQSWSSKHHETKSGPKNCNISRTQSRVRDRSSLCAVEWLKKNHLGHTKSMDPKIQTRSIFFNRQYLSLVYIFKLTIAKTAAWHTFLEIWYMPLCSRLHTCFMRHGWNKDQEWVSFGHPCFRQWNQCYHIGPWWHYCLFYWQFYGRWSKTLYFYLKTQAPLHANGSSAGKLEPIKIDSAQHLTPQQMKTRH